MRFRPCIDIHQGIVKQIVGSTLTDSEDAPQTNFQAEKSAGWFASLYKKDNLTGGHVIQLGPDNEKAAAEALQAWPGGMQIGGGMNIDNARQWLDKGAAAIIVTSWVFHDGTVDMNRLQQLTDSIGRNRLVLDLSCRKKEDAYTIVTNRWQTFTQETIDFQLLDKLSAYCEEFLIHAVDVEGKCSGIETDLVNLLGKWAGIPITYAGGIHTMDDINQIQELGKGHIDFTVGSALDIFGGSQLKYKNLAEQFGD